MLHAVSCHEVLVEYLTLRSSPERRGPLARQQNQYISQRKALAAT